MHPRPPFRDDQSNTIRLIRISHYSYYFIRSLAIRIRRIQLCFASPYQTQLIHCTKNVSGGKKLKKTNLFAQKVASLWPCPYKEVQLVIGSVDVISDYSQWGETSRLISFDRHAARVSDSRELVVDRHYLHVDHVTNRVGSVRQFNSELVFGVLGAIVVVPKKEAK